MNKNLWLKNYNIAKNYYNKYGNLLISKTIKTEDGRELNISKKGKKLRNWIHTQRKLYKKGMLVASQIKLLENIGMDWNTQFLKNSSNAFEENYQFAKEYYEEHNNLLVPYKYRTSDGMHLGEWIIKLRQLYKNGKLTDYQIKALENIKMTWNVYESSWNDYYQLAKKYYEKNNNLLIDSNFKTTNGIDYDENGCNLGTWISLQRQSYKGNGSSVITQSQIEKLEQIGIIWDKYDYTWNKNYDAAKKYYEEHNNLLVPSKYITKEGINLGSWLNTQKKLYKEGTLSSKSKELLDNIKMVWSGNTEIKWMRNYNLAKEYFNEHNNLEIPCDFKTQEGINLGSWIITQRRIYKGLKKGILTEQQIKLLEQIGMVWDISLSKKIKEGKENKWLKKYNLAKKYYEKYGNLDIPNGFKTKDGIKYDKEGTKLGSWITLQRKLYNGKIKYEFKDEHIELLDKIGMIWFINNVDNKLQNEKISKRNTNRKQVELLNRFKSYLLSLNQSNLPSKEEINNGFVKVLNRGNKND